MTVAEMIAIAEAAAKLFAVVRANVATGKEAMAATDIQRLQAILDPLHAENMDLSKRLDEALGEAAKR